jgi:uncharacterized protein (TIGR00730 family)
MNEKIAIFCSASDDLSPVYYEQARALGRWMGEHGKTLIYGGARAGLMEALAQDAHAAGATVMGMVPQILVERDRVSECLDVTFRTDDLSDRKALMLREADVCVALPGGVGTLDEVFTVMASATLDYHHKRVILFNPDGFWTDILHFLDGLEAQRFAHGSLRRLYAVASDLHELFTLLG